MKAWTAESKERRQKKVSELIRGEISQVLRREVKDPRVKAFTVTEVEVKPDLKVATVFICCFAEGDGHEPTAEEKTRLMKGLQSSGHFIYEALKRRLVMRQIPHIRFEYDERIASGSRMWGLVKALERPTELGEEVSSEFSDELTHEELRSEKSA